MNKTIEGNYEVQNRIAYGVAARWNRGSHSGQKIHRLYIREVVGVIDEEFEKAKGYNSFGNVFLRTRKPVVSYIYAVCGCCQGQFAGQEVKGATAEQVTCKRCAEVEAYMKQKEQDQKA